MPDRCTLEHTSEQGPALVDLESGETLPQTELDATPTSLTVVNPAPHDH